MTGENLSEGEYEYQYGLCNDGPEDDPPPALEMPMGYWRTRGGVTLKIRAMTSEHLDNAVRLFGSAGWGEHAKIRELRVELAGRR